MFEKYVLFENKGEIDPNSIKFMGCSTKNGNDTIGKFGTGLKYAIAVLLRNNVNVEIFSGKRKIEFSVVKKEIGGKEFDVVLVNGEETGMTTNLGVEWHVWQGFREFYANCLDEDGKKFNWNYKRQGKEGTTRVFIQETGKIADSFSNFKFEGWTPVSEGLFFSKKRSASPIRIFKEGFLVYEGDKTELSVYDYRVDHVRINEARLVENTWEAFYSVANVIAKMDFYNVNRAIDGGDCSFIHAWPQLGEGWSAAVESRGDFKTGNKPLDERLKQLRAVTDKKYRYYGSYYGSSESLIVINEIGDFDICESRYKLFSAAFKDNKRKFDFDLSKNEIYLNAKFPMEQKRNLLIVQELIENDQKDRSEFIIELLERIYPANV